MPKDHESVPPLSISLDGPESTSSPRFAPDQMVRCENCLRTNPPTRTNCLYCGHDLPLTEMAVNLQKPSARPLDKWEKGYNTIVLPPIANLTHAEMEEVADFLSLSPDGLQRILALQQPFPIARTATMDDAELIERRLQNMITTRIVTDEELKIDEASITKVRSASFSDEGMRSYQSPESSGIEIAWSGIDLTVTGRLTTTRVELKEQKSGRAESRILDSNQYFSDEMVVDFYAGSISPSYRIAAGSFDFSCLGSRKRLMAGENMVQLINTVREHAGQAVFDENYPSCRKVLELVWPAEQRTESKGLSRSGRTVSVGSANEVSNDLQFLRYSRLRYFFLPKVGS